MEKGTNGSPLARRAASWVVPHGGRLTRRLLEGNEAADLLKKAAGLPSLPLDTRTAADVELIATGVFSPLEGFLRRDDYLSVVRDMRLAMGGAVCPLPYEEVRP